MNESADVSRRFGAPLCGFDGFMAKGFLNRDDVLGLRVCGCGESVAQGVQCPIVWKVSRREFPYLPRGEMPVEVSWEQPFLVLDVSAHVEHQIWGNRKNAVFLPLPMNCEYSPSITGRLDVGCRN
nr:hypothetical protein [Corynebacterium diphtheriae]